MHPGDAFFWYAESATPELRPFVAGLFMLDSAPRRATLRRALHQLVAVTPRLRQQVHEPLWPVALPRWVDSPTFDIKYHLREIALPTPGTPRALFDLISALFATPMDRQRPLWEAYVVHGVERRRAAFFLRAHHSVMDGVGAIALLAGLTQAQRDAKTTATGQFGGPSASPGVGNGGWLNAGASVSGALIREIANGIAAPTVALHHIRRATRQVGQLVNDLMTQRPVGDPLVERCTGIGRRLDVIALPLARYRRIQRALGATLNDVFLATVCGALRAYYEQHRLPLHELHCVVPVNLREQHERKALGNRVGAVNVTLPLPEREPLACLNRISAQTAIAKRRRGGQIYQWLMRAVPLLPAALLRSLAHSVGGRVHLICSNMAGPPAPRYLAGAKIEAVYPFAPLIVGLPLSIALMSYANHICIGFDSDAAAVPDPGQVAALLEPELDRFDQLVSTGSAARGRA
jgi:WS/DGAT/MGAT family acyltransferase